MPLPLFIPPLIKVLAWGGSFIGAAIGVGKFTQTSEENYFNKGICKKCGGHFKPIEHHKNTIETGYRCDFCDNCVWISFGTDKGYKYVPSKHIRKDKGGKV